MFMAELRFMAVLLQLFYDTSFQNVIPVKLHSNTLIITLVTDISLRN